MKRIGLLFFVIGLSQLAHAQIEEVGPLYGNPQLQKVVLQKPQKINEGTFDSTFIYTSDTLIFSISNPIFDDFSSSKFQVYQADYTDFGVTYDKVYRLLDMADVPMSNDEFYTEQVTFRRSVDAGNASFNDVAFPSIQVKIGSLSSYPVVHVPTDVYPPYYIYDTVDIVGDEPDTIWILGPEVFQDSATQFFAPVNDPGLIWLDSEAYHNYSQALDPWSLGVASFDGLDENGFPYALGSTLTNYADHLTSKPIDLSGQVAGDSIYFSFLWQAQGFCDPPEQSDSLVLEFYAKDLDQWNWVWSTSGPQSGTPVSDFEHAHIKVDNSDYFKKGFQFRFKNYGSLAGSLDHFHIDYVNLRKPSGYQDTIIHDFAFVYPLYTLLETFTSVPWDHYQNSPLGKMSSNVQVVVRNSDNIPRIEQDGSTEILYNSVNEGNFVLMENLLNNGDLNYSPLTTYYSFHDFSAGDRFDETKTGLTQEFEVISGVTPQSTNPTYNDSTSTKQYFQNYYSYDDGTAEQAYGPTGSQSRLAIKYTPYEADSLIGAMIHFVPTNIDVTNNLFLLTVWADNGGEPGAVLYEDDVFFPRQPHYEYDRNIFTTYYFLDTMKIPVSGTFYVGWVQFDPERLGVGLDKNIDNSDKTYYSVDGGLSWNQSSLPGGGSVMIRPIFSTSFDAVIGIEEKQVAEMEVQVYPNPTSNSVQIDVNGGEFQRAEVYNIQGRKIIESKETTIDLVNYPSGMYFVKVLGCSKTFKVIKQ